MSERTPKRPQPHVTVGKMVVHTEEEGKRLYEEALREQGLDYYMVGGHAFYAQQEVFDVLNLTRRPALLLGMRELRLFKRVAIDFAAKRIYFDLPNVGR